MGQYTEVIKKREYRDKNIADIAESYLLGVTNCENIQQNHYMEDVMLSLEYILSRYNIRPQRRNDCITVEELLDCTLEQFGILYEQIDMKEFKVGKGDSILAFTENGASVVLIPSLFTYKYYIPSENKQGVYNKSMKLRDEAYVINRPISTEKFTLSYFVGFVAGQISFRDWLLIAVISMLISILGIAVPEINRLVLNKYVTMPLNEAISLISFACIGMAAVYIIRTILRATKEVLTAHICFNTNQKVENAFMSRILLLPMSYFRENTSGRISLGVIYSKKLAELVIGGIIGTSFTTFFSLAYVGEIANISVEIMIIAVLILMLKLAITITINLVAVPNEKRRINSERDIRDYNYMIIKSIEKIKTAGAENRVYSDWAWLYKSNLKYTYNPPFVVKIKSSIDILITTGGNIIILLIFANSGLPAADYIAFISIYGMLNATFDQIAGLSEKVTIANTYINGLKPIIDARNRLDVYKKSYVRELIGSVHFENVCMHYGKNNEFKIENLTMSVKPGEKIAIVGLSGCGKSSLINLLTGINTLDSGEIYIDGKSIKYMNQRSLCRQIGLVSQFSKLFPGSIRFNISLANENISDEEIWKALDDAEIGDTVRGFPNGLDTEVSENQSGGFSGGQKQRLLLARSFVGHHKIIILDEATSSLDNITQSKVLNNIYDMNATIIMIAHRLSTIKRCTKIYVMDDGKIVEQGTYDELLKTKGLFYELVENQLIEE